MAPESALPWAAHFVYNSCLPEQTKGYTMSSKKPKATRKRMISCFAQIVQEHIPVHRLGEAQAEEGRSEGPHGRERREQAAALLRLRQQGEGPRQQEGGRSVQFAEGGRHRIGNAVFAGFREDVPEVCGIAKRRFAGRWQGKSSHATENGIS